MRIFLTNSWIYFLTTSEEMNKIFERCKLLKLKNKWLPQITRYLILKIVFVVQSFHRSKIHARLKLFWCQYFRKKNYQIYKISSKIKLKRREYFLIHYRSQNYPDIKPERNITTKKTRYIFVSGKYIRNNSQQKYYQIVSNIALK